MHKSNSAGTNYVLQGYPGYCEEKREYAVVSGDDLTPQYSRVFTTLSEAADRTTPGDYVAAVVNGCLLPLSKEEEDEV